MRREAKAVAVGDVPGVEVGLEGMHAGAHDSESGQGGESGGEMHLEVLDWKV